MGARGTAARLGLFIEFAAGTSMGRGWTRQTAPPSEGPGCSAQTPDRRERGLPSGIWLWQALNCAEGQGQFQILSQGKYFWGGLLP